MFIVTTIATAVTGATAVITDSTYTAFQIAGNALGVLSQAHEENRVCRSGKPAGAILMCEVL